MNEKLHNELKNAFDQKNNLEPSLLQKNLSEKLKSADEHITLLQNTLTETEQRWQNKVDSLRREISLKDLQIEALSKTVKRTAVKPILQAPAIEVDFVDK